MKERLSDKQINTLAHFGHESAKDYLASLKAADREAAIKAGEKLVVLAKTAEREPGVWASIVKQEIWQTAWDMHIPLNDVLELSLISGSDDEMLTTLRTSAGSVRPSGTYSDSEVIHRFAVGELETTVS